MFARRRVVKPLPQASDFRLSSPMVQLCTEVLYYGERFSLLVADRTIFVLKSSTTWSDFRLPYARKQFCIEVLYYGGRFSLVVTDGAILYRSLLLRRFALVVTDGANLH